MKLTRTHNKIIADLAKKAKLSPDEYLTVLLEFKYKEVFKREYHRL